MIDHKTFYDKMPLTPVNLKRQHARQLKEEAQRWKEEAISEEAEQSEDGSDCASDDENSREDTEVCPSSPSDEASPEYSSS